MKRKAPRKPARGKRKAVARPRSAGVQVLAAFARDCRVAGREVEWVGMSSALAETAPLLNVSSMLALPATGEAPPA